MWRGHSGLPRRYSCRRSRVSAARDVPGSGRPLLFSTAAGSIAERRIESRRRRLGGYAKSVALKRRQVEAEPGAPPIDTNQAAGFGLTAVGSVSRLSWFTKLICRLKPLGVLVW